ncbi:MAG: DUF4278 domain-containing protein [Chloroflexaceae bacterium]|nr:DUF4278 domain-containing protein [Chloroflexaceae bacterium]
MKLSFLGAHYEYQPPVVEVSEGEVGGTYRGKPWKTHSVKVHQRHQHRPAQLTYRGVPYQH